MTEVIVLGFCLNNQERKNNGLYDEFALQIGSSIFFL